MDAISLAVKLENNIVKSIFNRMKKVKCNKVTCWRGLSIWICCSSFENMRDIFKFVELCLHPGCILAIQTPVYSLHTVLKQ